MLLYNNNKPFTCHFQVFGLASLPPMTLLLSRLWLKGASAQISPVEQETEDSVAVEMFLKIYILKSTKS